MIKIDRIKEIEEITREMLKPYLVADMIRTTASQLNTEI